MHIPTISTLFFTALCVAFPLEDTAVPIEPCAPSAYIISNYIYKSSASGTSLSFNFQSRFENSSLVTDLSSTGATCAASSSGGNLPSETECSTGRRNLLYNLAGPTGSGVYQIIHTWKCRNGQEEWMSSTRHKVQPLKCSLDEASGTTTCIREGEAEFVPENVRRICSTPTGCRRS